MHIYRKITNRILPKYQTQFWNSIRRKGKMSTALNGALVFTY